MVSQHGCQIAHFVPAEKKFNAEVAYQLQNTDAKVLLVHPSLLDVALPAAQKAGLGRDRLFLFDQDTHQSFEGLKDFRSIMADAEDARSWQWERLDADRAKNTTAVLNYSSGSACARREHSKKSLIIVSTEPPVFQRVSASATPT